MIPKKRRRTTDAMSEPAGEETASEIAPSSRVVVYCCDSHDNAGTAPGQWHSGWYDAEIDSWVTKLAKVKYLDGSNTRESGVEAERVLPLHATAQQRHERETTLLGQPTSSPRPAVWRPRTRELVSRSLGSLKAAGACVAGWPARGRPRGKNKKQGQNKYSSTS